MRTTLTLEDDVAALVEKLRRARGAPLKDVINEALRRGLAQMTAREPRPAQYRLEPVDLGACLLPSLDDVAQVLSVGEGEWHR
jgi:hypothetical protein